MNKKKKRTRKNAILRKVMVNRYGFYNLFGYNQQTNFLYPLYNTWINGIYYPAGMGIQRGPSFGGLDLYNLSGRDVAASWNTNAVSLTIHGFY